MTDFLKSPFLRLANTVDNDATSEKQPEIKGISGMAEREKENAQD